MSHLILPSGLPQTRHSVYKFAQVYMFIQAHIHDTRYTMRNIPTHIPICTSTPHERTRTRQVAEDLVEEFTRQAAENPERGRRSEQVCWCQNPVFCAYIVYPQLGKSWIGLGVGLWFSISGKITIYSALQTDWSGLVPNPERGRPSEQACGSSYIGALRTG